MQKRRLVSYVVTLCLMANIAPKDKKNKIKLFWY